jgi:peptidoglycan LD-endopeptidase LytH
MKLTRTTILLAGSLTLGACATGEQLTHPRATPPASARDAHATAATRGERTDDSRVRAWEDASRRAIRSGLSIAPSFRERVRFPAGAPHAIAYRFALREGQVLRIAYRPLDGDVTLFTEMFEYLGGEVYRPAGATPRGSTELTFTARTTGEYVLRLQPEIGGSGLFEVAVDGDSPLAFPVADASLRDIRSHFGDGRDGGARSHEGVDIFAPRGTPVVAAADGRVTQVGSNGIGGRFVWLADANGGLTYYYAHLDEHRVAQGAWVRAGDTIGTVGNTGNASGTSPHLHFGVYRTGRVALDPAPLLAGAGPVDFHAEVDAEMLGRWARTSGDRVRLRSSPSLAGAILAELTAATPVFVLGGVPDWHRVLLPDGTTGFMSSEFTRLEAVQPEP